MFIRIPRQASSQIIPPPVACMKCDIVNVHTNTSPSFVADNTSSSCLHESTDDVVFDFVQELYSLCCVDDCVWKGVWWNTERPDLSGITDLPAKVVRHRSRSNFHILSWGDIFIINSFAEFITHWFSPHIKTVMLVWRFGDDHIRIITASVFFKSSGLA